MQRSSGILLHPTSLPGPHPIGDIGPGAYAWIDWLATAGVRWWQMLPTNPPGFAASPYQSFSAFAGNTMLISPDLLVDDGFLDEIPASSITPGRVDFAHAEAWKQAIVSVAASRVRRDEDFDAFVTHNAFWLEDFALFMAIKRAYGGGGFSDWPEPIRRREPAALAEAREKHASTIDEEIATQFIFFDQWDRLRAYAREAGIGLIGDAPIFVAEDSADVWTHPDLFDLDDDLHPRVVAGVPPDYFAETGQLWGNPLYDWDTHRAQGYEWWISRLRSMIRQVDLVRIDHFRAFADYWEIPAGSDTAESGQWLPGPGTEFFDAVGAALGDIPLIAEDLGEIHDIVGELRDAVGLPGMKIGQFAYGIEPEPPEEWDEANVGYTGTHDNDTTAGWWKASSDEERARATDIGGIGSDEPARDLMRAVWDSPSVLAVAPVQDLLQLGTEARMNLPGTVGDHNWTFRLDALPDDDDSIWLRELVAATDR
jgi:4-alpha-glucanotransferase